MNLEFNHYGKRMVRVLRVQAQGPVHEVVEWEVDALLEGDLAGSYRSDDNSSVVPTDTVKNTIQALAHDLEFATRDGFAQSVAEHFILKYGHLTACDVEVRELAWRRMAVDGNAHPHSFARDSNGVTFSKVRAERRGVVRRSSGIRGLVILKTTESGFAGYPKCDLTTLPETYDRIFSTSLDAEWDFSDDCVNVDALALGAMLKIFAETYSPSVQRTLFQMAEAVLAAVPGIARIKITTPNKHYLNLDLTKLGRPAGQKKVFLPTDDPFGYIEAVVAR